MISTIVRGIHDMCNNTKCVSTVSPYMIKLKELTGSIDFRKLDRISINDVINADNCGSTLYGYPIFHSDKVTVIKAILEKGSEFPAHFHKGRTSILVDSGALEVLCEAMIAITGETISVGPSVVLNPGDFVVFPEKVTHSLKAIEKVEFLGITINGEDKRDG